MNIKEEKALIREEVKRMIDGQDYDEMQDSDEGIMRAVLASKAYKDSTSIFVYVSTDNEPDTLKIIRDALQNGKEVYVPKCGKKPFMKAVRISALKELRPGKFGILEPESEDGFEGKIDLAIVPCLTAAANGKRLGHGGGYYDFFLKDREIYKICLCRKKLLKNDLPTDDFDVMMDEILTD